MTQRGVATYHGKLNTVPLHLHQKSLRVDREPLKGLSRKPRSVCCHQEEPPKATKKSRKVSKEQLEVIQKKGLEQLRKQNEVNKYEKERKKKELNEKYEMMQRERKAEQDAKEKEQQPTPEPPKPKAKVRRPIKKIIEVYEDDEDDEEEEEEEEEEVIVKKVIKKKPQPPQPAKSLS